MYTQVFRQIKKKNEFLNSTENQKVINPSDSGKIDTPRPAYSPRFTALETGAVEDEPDPPEEEEESFMEQPVQTVSETVKASPIKKEPVPTYEEIADTMMEQKSNPSIITAVDPASVDFSDVRSISKAVIAEFASKDPILSSSLMRFENWKLEGELITATTDNRFLQMQTASKLNMVTDYLKNVSGKNLSFNLVFVPKQYHSEEVKLPAEVEILKNVFRGEIV